MAIQPIALQGLMTSPLTNALDQYQSGLQTRNQQAQEGRAVEEFDQQRRYRTATVLGRALGHVETLPEADRAKGLERYKQLARSLEPESAGVIDQVGLADLPALKAATQEELNQLQQFQLQQQQALAPYQVQKAQLDVASGQQGLASGQIQMEGQRLQNQGLGMDLDTKRQQAAYYAGGGALGDMAGGAQPVADGGSIVAGLFPGARITSTRRGADDPLTKANPGSWHAKSGGAVDVAPIPGMTFEDYVQGIRGQGYEIIEAINETGAGRSPHATGDHWHVVIGGGPAGAGAGAVLGAPAAGAGAPGSIIDRVAADPDMQRMSMALGRAQQFGDTGRVRQIEEMMDARRAELTPPTEKQELELRTARANAERAEREAAGGMTRNVRLSDGAIREMGKTGEGFVQLGQMLNKFQDAYAGYGAGGDWANWEARNFGTGIGGQSDEGSQWWQQYQSRKNLVRNELFGAALTATEAAEFNKADISPDMRPSQIRENLTRQREIVTRAARKMARTRLEQGADPDAVESAFDVPLTELGIDVGGTSRRYDGKKFERGGVADDIDSLLSKYGVQ